MSVIPFTLKSEHIALIKRLNLKISQDYACDNWLIPNIDPKRPFGNSDMLGDIFSFMGIEPDANGDYSESDRINAYLLLAELPAAMEAIMMYETFTPGIYEIDNCGRAFSTQLARNYITLSPALNVLKEHQELSKYFERTDFLCRSICGDNRNEKIAACFLYGAGCDFLSETSLRMPRIRATIQANLQDFAYRRKTHAFCFSGNMNIQEQYPRSPLRSALF